MARLNSFYLAPEDWPDSGPARLEGSEARHLTGVLRAAPGVEVRLFDGRGRHGIFRLAAADKRGCRLDPVRVETLPRPANRPILALGWNKSSRRDWLLEKAVELEAGGLVFWQAARSQGRVPDDAKEAWTVKLAQAAKQCGNPWLPEIEVLPGGVDALIAFAARAARCYVLWEGAAADETSPLLHPEDLVPGPCLLVIGPEGGLETGEVARLTAAGMLPVSLGRSVLRWETAALHALGLAFHARHARRAPRAEAP
ncbi:MAG: 16S rRNA (uracil(1498)-N(3))-methyltransferase [Desulfovibrionaceae bacterium]